MKHFIAFFSVMVLSFSSFAQQSAKDHVQRMNQCIVAFSSDNPRPLQLFQVSGIIEQAIEGRTQRIAMPDIQAVHVAQTAAGYGVTLMCQSELSCITLVKEDMSVMNMGETQFFFNSPAAANTFASSAKKLIESLQKTPSPVSINLFKSPDGKTPLLPASGSAAVAAQTKSETPTTPLTPTPPAKTEKSPLETSGNTGRDDEGRKSGGTGLARSANPQEGDEGDANVPDDLFCKQIKRIVQSGASQQFKDIQGKVMNAQQGTFESTMRLKGARRSYLSKFEGKPCFIAEMKSYLDNELAIEGLFDLQGQLEDCLGDAWENEDRSDDPAYDNVEFDAKDVELSDSANPNAPTVRIAIAPEGSRFILFLRIR